MTGTLTLAFIGLAVLCVVAGIVAVTRTRRAARADEGEAGGTDDEMTYAEEAAAVAAAQAAAAEAAAAEDAAGDDTAAGSGGAGPPARDHKRGGPPTA